MFDISHMGQLIADGSGTSTWLNRMLTNNVEKLEIGTGQYTFLLNDAGGIIDDLIIYRIGQDRFFLVVNASRIDEDFQWLEKHRPDDSQPNESERSFRRRRHSGTEDRGTLPSSAWIRRRLARA